MKIIFPLCSQKFAFIVIDFFWSRLNLNFHNFSISLEAARGATRKLDQLKLNVDLVYHIFSVCYRKIEFSKSATGIRFIVKRQAESDKDARRRRGRN